MKMNLNKINKNSKVLNISHADFDGISSSIVLSNFFKDIICKQATFSNIDDILKEIKYNDFDLVLVTDCFPKDPEVLNISDKILCLDHHPQSVELCNMKNIIAVPDNCGAVLTRNWVEAVFYCDLSHLNELLKYTNDYDLWIHNHSKSKMIETLFWKYEFDKFKERFMSGNVRFTKDEIEYLKNKRNDFRNTYDNLEVFELETINGCFCFVKEFINDIADRLLMKDGYEIAIVQNVNNNHTSIRTKDDNVHIGNILQELDIGGGHPKSGGFGKYSQNVQLRKDIETLEKYLFDNVENWRRL